MAPDPDAIAQTVIDAYNALPSKRKPQIRNDGSKEWTILSGIVLSKPLGSLTCVSLGTGLKCLPLAKVPLARGTVLHDWHAEILAIRAFNRFLVDECANVVIERPLAEPPASQWLRPRSKSEMDHVNFQPFQISDDVGIHLYISEAPCGDASMELTMAAQDDATPWAIPETLTTSGEADEDSSGAKEPSLRGRGYFSELGVVRRKPSRADAPETLSKSCSDKLAMKQCTSLLGSTAALFVHPSTAYLHSLVLPASQNNSSAMRRSFSAEGRMCAVTPTVTQQWQGGYAFRPFQSESTDVEFEWSRQSSLSAPKLVPSNLSAVCTPHWQETLIGGVLQGRKQFDPKGASRVCRKSMVLRAAQLAVALGLPVLQDVLQRKTYEEVKGSDAVAVRRGVLHDIKEHALKGWVPNVRDDFFLESTEPGH